MDKIINNLIDEIKNNLVLVNNLVTNLISNSNIDEIKLIYMGEPF